MIRQLLYGEKIQTVLTFDDQNSYSLTSQRGKKSFFFLPKTCHLNLPDYEYEF